MDISSADQSQSPGSAERIVADCLIDLNKNAPAETVLTRLRAIESQILDSAGLRARYLRVRAIANNRLGFPTEALGDLFEARNILRHAQDERELADVIRTIALIHTWRGEGREAALALLQAAAVVGTQPDELASVLIEAGRLHIEIGRPQEAVTFFRSALDIATQALPDRERERVSVNLIQSLVAGGEIEEANPRLEAILASSVPRSQRSTFLLHIEAMRIAIALSDNHKARTALARAAEFVEPAADSFSQIELTHAQAEFALAAGHAAEAEKLLLNVIGRYADGADDLAPREITARLQQASALDMLSRTDEADRTLAAALRRAVARGLIGYADLIRSRIAARGGSDRVWYVESPITGPANDPTVRFVRRRRLGAGGYGTVERAYDLELGIEVAIKRIVLDGVYDISERPRLFESARTEVAAASRIEHPGVVRIYGMLTDPGGNVLIIEELVEGATLRSMMYKQMPMAQALDLLSRIAFSLAAVHAAGIVHRDLKPENIILRRRGTPVLVDFGVAVVGHQKRVPAAGTHRYMPPEQIRGRHLDGRTDLYALGVIARDLLLDDAQDSSGAESPTILGVRRYRRELEHIGVDHSTARLLASLLAPYRWLRPPSAAAVGAHLARCVAPATPSL